MTWEYLYEKRLDWRFKATAGFLRNHIKDAVIVDVDCMHAPLLSYLPATWSRYIGNDIQSVFPPHLRATFLLLKDEVLPQTLPALVERVDILCCFGVGGFELSGEPMESPTLTNTLITLTRQYRPPFLVLEGVQKYREVIDRILKETAYVPVFRQHRITRQDWVEDRTLIIASPEPHRRISRFG